MDNETQTPEERLLAGLTDIKLGDEAIESVQQTTKAALEARYGKYKYELILGYGIWIGLITLIWTYYDLFGRKTDPFWWLIATPVIVAGAVYRSVKARVTRQFYQQFASRNGFTYAQKSSVLPDGSLFTYGDNRQVINLVEGKLGTHGFQLMNYEYVTGSGKQRQRHHTTVTCIDYGVPLPHIMLLIDWTYFGWTVTSTFNNLSKIELPTEVEKKFNLYTERKYEIEALQTFSPDFLLSIYDQYHQFGMEFTGTKLYVFAMWEITTKAELEHMFAFSQLLATRLAPSLKRMSSGVQALHALHQN